MKRSVNSYIYVKDSQRNLWYTLTNSSCIYLGTCERMVTSLSTCFIHNFVSFSTTICATTSFSTSYNIDTSYIELFKIYFPFLQDLFSCFISIRLIIFFLPSSLEVILWWKSCFLPLIWIMDMHDYRVMRSNVGFHNVTIMYIILKIPPPHFSKCLQFHNYKVCHLDLTFYMSNGVGSNQL